MTAITRIAPAAVSANDLFKLRYPRYLRGAAVAALVLAAIMVWLSPQYQPKPYVLRNNEIICVEIEEPPPVDEPLIQPAPPPVIPPVLEIVDDGVEVDPFDFPDWSEVWNPTPPAPVERYDDFVASSAKPVLTFQAKPDYPALARQAGLEGTVLVHVLVGPGGEVIDAVLVRGVHPLLDRAALQAARQCRFTPAKQREFPVKAWLAVPYRFALR